MNIKSLVWPGIAVLVSTLSACGTEPLPVSSSAAPSSSSTATSSTSSSASVPQTSVHVLSTEGGYVTLSNGDGGVNYEPVAITMPGFDKAKSLDAFKETLYPFLKSSGCGGCHSSTTASQAPLHTDADPELAHEYALTRVNFKDPENSKFVVRMKIDRHNCPGSSCASAGEKMLAAVEDWKNRIDNMLPETPRGIAASQTISEGDITSWIAADKTKLAAGDVKYNIYTSMHELHNEGLTADELNIVRTALSKALNSTARWAPEIVNPTDVTGDGILYRIDIRDYWGYNQGVKELLFGGSDDDLAFGGGKRDYRGNAVSASVQNRKYGFTNQTTKDPEHALRIWERILHGNVEGAVQQGTIPPYIDGFKGTRKTNAAGEYVDIDGFEWVETAQLIYTITRPDVYNSIMTLPMYADEMERNLEVDISDGMDSYDYMVTFDAITVDSRLLWRAKRSGDGWYWKTWDVFTGQLDGRDRSIFDVYSNGQEDIRFPFWANPIPKFVHWRENRADTTSWSFVATLAQPFGNTTSECDPQPNFSGIDGFYNCQHFDGSGGLQQSASEIIFDLPNGLQGYYLTGGFNQRRVDAFTNIVRDPRIITDAADDIAYATGYSYTRPGGGFFGRQGDPRLNVGSSCIGCHAGGMNRTNNDLRDWLDNSPDRLPKGKYGVDGWINDTNTVARVKELYPTNEWFKETIEKDRKGFLDAIGKIKDDMIWGEDKNVYVEPVIWTVEYVQRVKYQYKQTTSN